MGKKIMHEEFVERVKEKYNDEYVLKSNYVDAKTKIIVKHSHCGKLTETTSKKLMPKYEMFECEYCKGKRIKKETIKEQEEFNNKLSKIYKGEYRLAGKYYSSEIKTTFSHDSCGSTFVLSPNEMLNTVKKCPICGDEISKEELVALNKIEEEFIIDYKDALINSKLNYQIHEKLPLNELVIKSKGNKVISHGGRKLNNSGVYIFTDNTTGDVLYVGTSVDLLSRLTTHYKGWGNTSLKNMISSESQKSSASLNVALDNVIAQIIFDKDILSQLFLEKYLIYTLNPKFNKEAILKHKADVLIEDKIMAINMLR